MSKPVYRWDVEYTDGYVRTFVQVRTKKELSNKISEIFDAGNKILSLTREEV